MQKVYGKIVLTNILRKKHIIKWNQKIHLHKLKTFQIASSTLQLEQLKNA